MKDAASEMTWSLSDWEASSEDYEKLLNDYENWSKIPLLNVVPSHELRDQQLVRFQGMVQYMGNPEYFLGHYEVIHNETNKSEMRCGRYRDLLNCLSEERVVESSQNVIEERQILYCITTPALNDWVVQENSKSGRFLKVLTPSTSDQSTSSNAKKRSVEEDVPMDVDSAPSFACTSAASSSSIGRSDQESKRMATDSVKNVSKSELTALNLNFPIDGTSGMACLLKLYDNDSSLKLNDVVEAVGFLSIDPALASIESSSSSDAENRAKNPPPSMVPRLHALRIRKVLHSNSMPSDLGEIFKSAMNIRKELHLVLSQVLLGDTLAAEYLICHLLSLVYMRKDGMALGHLSLNFSNLPNRPEYTRLLYSILMRILPKSHYLAMTLNNMNMLSFTPKMDYEENRLSSGLLQLSDHTHLIIDETRLETGRLDTMGVRNFQALKTLISHQTVSYDFQYYSKSFDVDIPVLVLSEGKSLLPSDVLVPLCPDANCVDTIIEIFQAANHFLREPLLSSIRLYLAAIKHSSYEFPEEVQKRAQEDFVEMRRVEGQLVSGDDLHLLLVLARLISLSYGQSTVTIEAWDQAKKMEKERKTRLTAQSTRPNNPSNEP